VFVRLHAENPGESPYARPSTVTKAKTRVPSLPPEYQGLSRFRRPWRNLSRSGVREFREGGREFQGPVDMLLLHAKVHTRAVASENAHGNLWPDDCDLQLGRFVTIKRTISIDCNSFGCKYPSPRRPAPRRQPKMKMVIVRPVVERRLRSRSHCPGLRFLLRDCQSYGYFLLRSWARGPVRPRNSAIRLARYP
jgi:hypothetical protein